MYFLWGRDDRHTILYMYIHILYGLQTAVPFMWGSLRLAAININITINISTRLQLPLHYILWTFWNAI